jgi:hypothetical protein
VFKRGELPCALNSGRTKDEEEDEDLKKEDGGNFSVFISHP